VANLAELVRAHTDLSESELAHLQRLIRNWSLLSDISFADVLLFAQLRGDPDHFVILAQIRPTTGPTLYRADRVGELVDAATRPLLTSAFRSGQIVDGGLIARPEADRIRVLDVPVRCGDRIVGVLSRQFSPDLQRDPGELELHYFTVCRRVDRMIAQGVYPFAVDDDESEEQVRVGDGVMLVDAVGRIEFASPNVVSAFARLGCQSSSEGQLVHELGFGGRGLREALERGIPRMVEIEQPPDVTVAFRCLPLVDAGEVTGGLVLVRDISDLRRRDRLLVSKDATIAEIHHRVKNNLQTVSSLLSLQGRRVAAPEAKAAIEESARRIRSIAVVHEILSQEVGDAAPFSEILGPLLRMIDEGLVATDRPLEFKVEGDAGVLRSDQATHMAVVLTEILQNVVDHAFPTGPGLDDRRVVIAFDNDGEHLAVSVIDNGVGVAELGDGLGLTIVRNLVRRELGGTIEISDADGAGGRPGTRVELHVPLSVEPPR
jgi:two-component sensor histidine kinase